MDPFHVVALAGDKLTVCRQRLQQAVHGRRGRTGDVSYRGRKTLLIRRSLLTDRQHDRLNRIFTEHDAHVAIEVTWLFYQDIIDAYQHPQPSTGASNTSAASPSDSATSPTTRSAVPAHRWSV